MPESDLRDDIKVRHLLTHTSEGIVGQGFVYGSTRYALLGDIMERVTGQTFEQAVRGRVIEPAGMEWYESPDLLASDGLISTVDQMARYAQALDCTVLLDEASMRRLATPSISQGRSPLPLSLGWFAQTMQGTPVMWSYGQAPDAGGPGALVFRVPERKLSLLLLANQNTISDTFRLLMEDVRKSPFAMTFLPL